MLLFANSLDGVRGGLVSGFSPPWAAWRGFPVWGGHSHSRRASQFERRTMWGQPPSAVRRSAALLAVQRSCPPLKKLDGGRASPPVQVRALACFQIPPHAIPNHVGGVSSAQPSEALQLMGLSSRTSLICELRNLPTNRRSRFKSTENPA